LMPAQYHQVLAPQGAYYEALMIDPGRKDLLQLLGVGYFLTSGGQPFYNALKASGDFRPMQPADSYFTAFAVLKPKPAYRWELEEPRDSIDKNYWSAERREFTVNSQKGGRFILIEQFFPGWHATVDGTLVNIQRWNHAFQSISVPAGEHRIGFRFASRGLRLGAMISVVSLLGFVLCCVVCGRYSSASSSR
jgi:Bacterial membrane protein YfhO